METQTDHREMLEQLTCPAFLVKDKIVVQANQAALNRQLNIGDSIEELISIGQQEYAGFAEGRLYLSLSIASIACNATVVKFQQYDLFCLEDDYEAPELRAFALAAQCLREQLTDALTAVSNISSQSTPQIKEATRSLYQLHRAIGNMSDVANYEQPRIIRTENRNVVALFKEYLDKAADVASAANRTLHYTLPNQAIYCTVDSEKLERAVLNLVSNAIKFSPKESTIYAELYQLESQVFFSIKNNCTTTANSVTNPFARYLREPGPDSKNAGIGLGLVVVRATAISHGGTLLIDHPGDDSIRITMSISAKRSAVSKVNSPMLYPIDYAGGYDHTLVELSDVLPLDYFE